MSDDKENGMNDDKTGINACEQTWERIKRWEVPARTPTSTWYDRLAAATASLDLPPPPRLEADALDGLQHRMLILAADMMTLVEDAESAGLPSMAKNARDLATTYAWLGLLARILPTLREVEVFKKALDPEEP